MKYRIIMWLAKIQLCHVHRYRFPTQHHHLRVVESPRWEPLSMARRVTSGKVIFFHLPVGNAVSSSLNLNFCVFLFSHLFLRFSLVFLPALLGEVIVKDCIDLPIAYVTPEGKPVWLQRLSTSSLNTLYPGTGNLTRVRSLVSEQYWYMLSYTVSVSENGLRRVKRFRYLPVDRYFCLSK